MFKPASALPTDGVVGTPTLSRNAFDAPNTMVVLQCRYWSLMNSIVWPSRIRESIAAWPPGSTSAFEQKAGLVFCDASAYSTWPSAALTAPIQGATRRETALSASKAGLHMRNRLAHHAQCDQHGDPAHLDRAVAGLSATAAAAVSPLAWPGWPMPKALHRAGFQCPVLLPIFAPGLAMHCAAWTSCAHEWPAR